MISNINQIEKDRIRQLYYNTKELVFNSNYVIIEWLSPDEKYAIFLDELYDIKNKTKIGDIWENFENFKFFLKHSFTVSENIPKQIRESVITSLNSFVLTESNQNMSILKPYVKQLIHEKREILENIWDWAKEQGKSAIEGTKKFIDKSVSGLKQLYTNIKDSEWTKVFDIIGKGILYVARSIRSALYHPVGMILDAILIATGVGKGFQFAIWAIVVGLDIYELVSGNYEEKDMGFGWRLLFFAVDILGLVTSAAAAKAANVGVGKLLNKFGRTDAGAMKAIESSPMLKSLGETISNQATKADGLLQKAMTHLQKNSPKIHNFLSGVVKYFRWFLNQVINLFKGTLKVGGKVLTLPSKAIELAAPASMRGSKIIKGTGAAANQIVPMYGAHAYGEYKLKKQEEDIINKIKQNNITPDWSDIDL